MKIVKFLIAALVVITGCRQKNDHAMIEAGQEIVIDSIPGQCPYLTRDLEGNEVISWVRMINDSTTSFCYAVSSDGTTFGDPVVITASHRIQPHGENLPKIIFKPTGEIIALWGSGNPNVHNKYSGLVYYTQSFDKGKSWSDARALVNDTASYDQRYYDVAMLPNGETGIIWLDNRKTTNKDGSALYFASTSGRNGFGAGRLISQPCCQCCRTDLFVDSKNGVHALFRGIIQDSIRDMVHIVSNDGGNSFSEPARISEDNWVLNGCPHTGPAMTENANGIHFAWFTGGGSRGCYYTKSTDNGHSFVSKDSVSSKGSHPQLAPLSNGDVVIVWDEGGMMGEKAIKKIGLQLRDANGRALFSNYITSDTSMANYPVVSSLKDGSALIAYTIYKHNKPFIAFQKLNVNN